MAPKPKRPKFAPSSIVHGAKAPPDSDGYPEDW